jgi:hypothetical protein
MSSTLKSTLAVVFAAVVFAAPASAAVDGQSAGSYATRHASFYQDAQQAQIAESRFYESTVTSSGADTSGLPSVLVACAVMLVGSAALAAWRLNRDDFPARIATAREASAGAC